MRRDEAGGEHGERRDAYDDEGDLPAQHEQDDEHAEDGRNARQQLREAQQKSVRELLRIRQDDARDFAVRAGVEIFEGQPLELCKGVLADAGEHMKDDAVVDEAERVLRGERHGDAGADGGKETKDAVIVDLPLPDDAIDRLADEIGYGELRGDGRERAQHREREKGRKGPQIAENAAHCRAFCRNFLHCSVSFACEAAISR